jgi:hypothetical protein
MPSAIMPYYIKARPHTDQLTLETAFAATEGPAASATTEDDDPDVTDDPESEVPDVAE